RAGMRFPAWLPTQPEWTSRVAWCYGDLGVSVALLSAATATGRDDWREDAIELARESARRPPESSQVIDAGLCHGAAGVAHLFNRLAQATGDAELARAADAWFVRTLAMRRDDAIAGFPRAQPKDGAAGWEAVPDLLTGASGVALALHAAISAIEPAWDQLLLADLAPRRS
ncbi:MAG TPA: lanthionine synthetase LanC family protein, partial [Kofleriaceae bacterium]|nr:lanthionine synthetase LanC family protein [Kofleriaceae bacterium]